ncbi:hypothetical protein [Ruegeria meonggei]|uniref:Uncharacterized protein n=1 Tax=Ruegeria meonggei TaxID=1446476 RepID=A0A1X7ADL0_9RHOB|nr:hypothetical protein [Ruegeria meonggei]SLN76724.1 hypothetical protein RUM8411_04469 [Ruegeria meonggei]
MADPDFQQLNGSITEKDFREIMRGLKAAEGGGITDGAVCSAGQGATGIMAGGVISGAVGYVTRGLWFLKNAEESAAAGGVGGSILGFGLTYDPGGSSCKDGNTDNDDANAHQSAAASPLIIDLDGDGIELTPLDGSGVYFDLNVDGFAERTGWVGPDDGLAPTVLIQSQTASAMNSGPLSDRL